LLNENFQFYFFFTATINNSALIFVLRIIPVIINKLQLTVINDSALRLNSIAVNDYMAGQGLAAGPSDGDTVPRYPAGEHRR